MRKAIIQFCSLVGYTIFFGVLQGCKDIDSTVHVQRPGDTFYDDAIKKLSEDEINRFRSLGIDTIRGFLFITNQRHCIVFFTTRNDILSTAKDPAFCYSSEDFSYLGRL